MPPTSINPHASLAEIAAAIRSGRNFIVMSHVRPDGDALGSSLAMALCLREIGKQAVVWNQDGLPEKFTYLPGAALVRKPPEEGAECDVAIVLDTATRDRAGTCLRAVTGAPLWVNIDHHVTNDRYGDLAHVEDKSPATGQILYELFRGQDLPLTGDMAENLFVAISTDTGSFQYPNTTARTYEVAADLVKRGVNVGKLSQQMYESYPRRRLELLRYLLNVLKFTSQGQAASIALPLHASAQVGARAEDTEGLIDVIRAVDGVIVAAFLEELPEGKVRASLRSKDQGVDVAKVCGQFGGGGHVLAAGARISGTLAEVEAQVLAAIDSAISSGLSS